MKASRVLLLSFLLGLTSCLAGGGPPAEQPCDTDEDCPGGQVCERCAPGDGACVLGCRQGSQCPPGQTCIQVECVQCPCPNICA